MLHCLLMTFVYFFLFFSHVISNMPYRPATGTACHLGRYAGVRLVVIVCRYLNTSCAQVFMLWSILPYRVRKGGAMPNGS
jgi:hypothetical protein